MKKIKLFVICVSAISLLVGCNSNILESEEGTFDSEVSLCLTGEISFSDIPLTKAEGDDLYLIQVYRGTSKFAFGIFDDLSRKKLYLKSGNDKYRIIVVLIKNGKTLIGDNYCNANKGWLGNKAKESTFFVQGIFGAYFATNRFHYNSIACYYYESNYSTTPKNKNNAYGLEYLKYADIYGDEYPACNDWLYGEINDYSPNGGVESLSVNLKRVGFKLQCEVNGITDGTVTVKISNSTKTFFNQSISSSTYTSNPVFYAFYDAYSAWKYADDYSENFTLAVTWKRGIGITEDYGTKTIQLRRNCLNNIKISMGNNDQSAGMSIRMEAESSIGSDNVSIPVQ